MDNTQHVARIAITNVIREHRNGNDFMHVTGRPVVLLYLNLHFH
jgi:hypothetical protein